MGNSQRLFYATQLDSDWLFMTSSNALKADWLTPDKVNSFACYPISYYTEQGVREFRLPAALSNAIPLKQISMISK